MCVRIQHARASRKSDGNDTRYSPTVIIVATVIVTVIVIVTVAVIVTVRVIVIDFVAA